jgi:2-keto-4-pentenoate hydratase/2-oxohepta-3-ene-1,7-dioic acid hydratase in catechol pathway
VTDPAALEVQCWKNEELLAKNVVDNMIFSPGCVISLLSRVHGLYAGDVITMGTPKPYPIARGDVIKCVIRDSRDPGDGTALEFEPLICPVK